ncbi:MAG: hypothetical protein ACT4QE_12170 [Anaerolineales bacterium]
MRDDYLAQFIVGVSTALVAAVFNLAITGQINGWWVLVAFAAPIGVLQLYQRVGLSPTREWRVRDNELSTAIGQSVGDGAWELDATEVRPWAVYGPWKPLAHGKYRATFQLKISSVAGDQPVVDIDVAARHGKKIIALRTLTARDFGKADSFQRFPLDFYLLQDENEIEFRVSTKGIARRVVLDSVKVVRRL